MVGNMKSEQDIKAFIKRYFSDDLQYDESIAGAMERKQLQKWLLDWAGDREQYCFKEPEIPSERA